MSPMSVKGWAMSQQTDDTERKYAYIDPFWTVLLSDRNTSGLVNMAPYLEEWKLGNPTPSLWVHGRFGLTLTVKLPFLTNSQAIEEGALLVLPYDGGLTEICCGS